MQSEISETRVCDARTAFRCVMVAVGVGVLMGCVASGPKVSDVPHKLPSEFRHAPTGPAVSAPEEQGQRLWWKQLGSPELNALVDLALAKNAELQGAEQQIVQARAREEQTGAGRLPTLSAPIRAVEQSQGNRSDSQNQSQIILTGSYRLDVWGEQAATAMAAKWQVQRAVHDRDNLQRLLIGGLVDTYIAYLSALESLAAARVIDGLNQKGVELTEYRLALGDATLEEVERQKITMEQQRITVAGLENQVEELHSSLSRHIGVLPANVKIVAQSIGELKMPQIAVGVPSDLLFGRPDIRAMEDRMRAADANIEVARARLLPPVDLSAQAGYSGAALASLLQPQNLMVSAAASLAVAIFDGGAKKAERAFAQAFHEEMVVGYGKTILQAIRETESALASLRAARRKLDTQAAVTQSMQRVLQSGMDAYRVGAMDQFTVLEHRKNVQRSTDDLRRAKADMLRSYVSLSVALGLGSSKGANSADATVAQGHTSDTQKVP